jgi:hypothetical protein
MSASLDSSGAQGVSFLSSTIESSAGRGARFLSAILNDSGTQGEFLGATVESSG